MTTQMQPELDVDKLAQIAALASDYTSCLHDERREVALAYLFEVAELLTAQHGDDAIIAPLLDIIPYVSDPTTSPLFADRRSERSSPSEAVLARAAVAIDVWQSMGHTADGAAQAVARQLVNSRASLPTEGGDVRGWKRLLIWRDRLVSLKKPAHAWQDYVALTKEIEKMNRPEVVRRANDGSLWDIRKRAAEAKSR
ncbi:MAG: hypothetical protein KDJ37_08195 [Hyphomicrobiaceae bacterium]|nr:hypothetical protein [Hyphomicrobiaceae bacterium]